LFGSKGRHFSTVLCCLLFSLLNSTTCPSSSLRLHLLGRAGFLFLWGFHSRAYFVSCIRRFLSVISVLVCHVHKLCVSDSILTYCGFWCFCGVFVFLLLSMFVNRKEAQVSRSCWVFGVCFLLKRNVFKVMNACLPFPPCISHIRPSLVSHLATEIDTSVVLFCSIFHVCLALLCCSPLWCLQRHPEMYKSKCYGTTLITYNNTDTYQLCQRTDTRHTSSAQG